ncbi:T9SS type A sorting domain-containing protein [Phaeocystidibacter luteus]|uniref:T9SS type A sorting domain-containing protein n=1 Tax=Phaeocystidibacter luteus TaxID=911197 RepID=A0A6N6RKP8_9FLAO|nr:T9SS type A sorting domain-containing protein [Phaeocystidibacter luteus]KAB2808140.1 T9SS type A sorting domain-containing protein [Phaeocystidibacter luteus]
MKKLFTLFALLSVLSGFGSHFSGGYFRAQYLGSATNGRLNYRIEFYATYSGTAIFTPTVDIVSPTTTSTVSLAFESSIPHGPIPYSMELRRYVAQVQLLPNTDYMFSYELCCRPNGMQNITPSSGIKGLFIWSTLNTGNGNSHPEMIAPPASVIASNRDYPQSIRAYDKDGDLVSYRFGQVYENDENSPVPLNSAFVDSVATLPNTILTPDGMVIYQYTSPSGSYSGFSIGYKIVSRDQSGQINSVINIDWPVFVSLVAPPPQNKPILLLDSLFTHPSRYDFRLNRADTVGFHLSTNSNAGLFIPRAFNIVQRFQRMVTRSYPISGAKWLEFTITPTANDLGREIPTVLRFEVGQYFIDHHFDFSVVTGIGADEFNSSELVVYPNPTRDVVRVIHSVEMAEISILDASGREVGHEVVSGLEVEVHMPNEAGLYFLKIVEATGRVSLEPVLVVE